MSAFLNSFAGYIIEMVCMVVLGICGGYVGYRLRKRKDSQSQDA